MGLREFFGLTPEFKAQSNGVGLGVVVGWVVCYFAGLPEGWFFVLTILSMFPLSLAFWTHDAIRAKAGKPAVTLRTLFWRGISEAGLGFALMLTVEALRTAT